MSKKFATSLHIAMLAAFVLSASYLFYNRIENDEKLKALSARELHGVVIKSQKKTRGLHYIEFRAGDTTLQYILTPSWFFEDNAINANDSVSKVANSGTMTFYKLKNGVYNKCCDYEIGM